MDETKEMEKKIVRLEEKIACLQEELRHMCGLLTLRDDKIRQLETMKYNTELECERLKGKIEVYERRI